MNWKLILGLSAVGLGMAFASVFSIPSDIEPICWVAVFLVSTYFIASGVSERYFLHGFLVVFFDCIFATVTQVLLSEHYLSRHKLQVDAYAKIQEQTGLTPEQIILISRPALGILLGAVVGFLAVIASKYFSTGEVVAPAVQKQEEPEPYTPGYQSDDNYQSSYQTNDYNSATNTVPVNAPESLVYSVIVLVNPSEKQIEWATEGNDNENAVVIPNVMNHSIKGLTFRGTHFDLMD